MRKLFTVTFIFSLLIHAMLMGQTTFEATYTFGADGNVESFTYNGTNYDGIIMGNFVKVGVSSSGSTNNFRATNWPLGATNGTDDFTGEVDTDKYLGFTISPAPGYAFTVGTITFGIGRSAAGTRQSQWRGSSDNYTNILTDYTELNENLTNTVGILTNPDLNSNWTGNVLNPGALYENLTETAGFRFYLFNSESASGTAGLQGPVTISGTFEALGGNTPPSIANIVQTPDADIDSETTVSVSADITEGDGPISVVELRWGTASGSHPNAISMTLTAGETYTTDTDIPAQENGTTVYYVIYAEDVDENSTTSDEQNYTVADPVEPPTVITLWDFEANPLEPDVNNPDPVIGIGFASAVGNMGTLSRGTGSVTGCSQQSGTGAWAFGSVSPGENESSGAQFMVSTLGYEQIVFTYDQRFSNTSTRTVRIQYTLNGTDWINLDVTSENYMSECAGRGGIDLGRIDIGDPVGTNVSDGWSRRTFDFSAIEGVNNNPDFGVRIVAAHYANTGEFRQANNVNNVATAGTWRFDNVTFAGYEMMIADGGMETFDNSNATTAYTDGSFIGDNGFVWNYFHSRDEDTFPIDGKGLMLRRASESKLESAPISGGIGSFSVQMRKAYTGTAERQLELYINGELKGTSQAFGTENPDPTIYLFEVNDINVPGDFVMMIKNVGSTTTNRQVVIDNIIWTGFEGAAVTPPSIANIIQTPDENITSATTVAVAADVTAGDAPLASVELKWGTASGTYPNTIAMTAGAGDTYTTSNDIPAQADGTTVYYVVHAVDTDNESATSAEQMYIVKDPNFTTLPYSQTFDTDLGDTYIYSVSGDTRFWQWAQVSGNGVARMNGFNTGELEEDWLILPGINMNDYEDVVMSFETFRNFGSDNEDNYLKLMYSTNYTGIGNPTAATWTELPFVQPSANQVWTASGDVDLSGISGTDVWIAFKYHYNVGFYRLWEVDNILIEEAIPAIPPSISNIVQTPDTDIDSETTVSVSADVSQGDAPIASVQLMWGTSTGDHPHVISMTLTAGETYTTDTDIPAQENGTTVYYVIYAEDVDENSTTSDEQNYTVADPVEPPTVITLWDFEANPLEPDVNNPDPVIGIGFASAVGNMGTLSRGTGSVTGCSQQSGTGAWAFGSVSPGENESSGAQFMVSTLGYEQIVFTYDQRFSNTSTRTVRIQYTLNGTDWINLDVTSENYMSECAGRGGIDLGRIDIGDPVGTNVSDGWSRRTFDFSAIEGVNNNPDFGVRIVAAHYANTGEFRQANNVNNVATAGTWRFDNVTFAGYEMMIADGGMETFDNSNATTAYTDGSFIGDNGFVWNYFHSRDEDTFPIDGKGLMLRRASESKLESAPISGGIGSFSVQMRKAYTGTAERQLELYINGELKGTSQAFGTENPDPTIYLFEVNDINVPGDFVMMIKNVGSTTTNRQVVIDNIIWTGFEGAAVTPPSIANIIQTPDENITSATTVAVAANVSQGSAPIANVELRWGNASGDYPNTITMTLSSGNTYETVSDIPAQADATTVYYLVHAVDENSETATSAEQMYIVKDPNFTTLPYSQTFDTDLGDTYTYSVSGDTRFWQWAQVSGNGVARMNGFNTGELEEDWLILPGINMNDYEDVVMSFETFRNFGSDNEDNYLKLMYSTNYTGIGNTTAATWTELPFVQPSANQVWTASGDVDLSGISGTDVWIAFKYHYNVGFYRLWEVDNILIEEAAAIVPPSITNIVQTPDSDITSETSVSVSADVTAGSAPISLVQLEWGTASGDYPNVISMTLSAGDTYTTDADIPAQANGTTVYYVVYAEDVDENSTTSIEQSYAVNDPIDPESIIALWDFNGPSTAEVPGGPTSPEPAIGEGVASLTGGTTASFASGTASGGSSDPETTSPPNYGWNTTNYPAQGTNPKTAGVVFAVSTLGFEDIQFMFDQRLSNTAANTWVVQYTLDYSLSSPEWIDAEIFTFEPQETGTGDVWYNNRFVDLSAVAGLNNNPDAAIRIVSDFDPVAGQYLAARSTSNYGPGGTSRFDMVTFTGSAAIFDGPVQLAITNVNGGVPPTVNQAFTLTVQARDANDAASVVTEDTEVALTLATGSGTLSGTLTGTIAAGNSNFTFADVIYNIAESGVSITASAISGMMLDPATSATFEVLPAATQLAFVNFPETGMVFQPIGTFTVEARRPDNTVDDTFSGEVALSKASGPGELSGTLVVNAMSGVATFDDIAFDEEGDYTLTASSTGLSAATSDIIAIAGLPEGIIAQWNFNGPAADAIPGGPTSPEPSIGTGDASLTGGITASFATGTASGGSSDPETTAPPNYAWNTTAYPAQGENPKTAGVVFAVSTLGYQNIEFMFDQRLSNTAANTWMVQYTLDNSQASPVWVDAELFTFEPQETGTGDVWYNQRTVDLTSVSGLNNNTDAAFRIVSDFDPVTGQYRAANSNSNYSSNGTSRYDMVTIFGDPSSVGGAEQLAITNINGGVPPTVGQPFSLTVQARDENGSAAAVSEDTEITLTLATGTGTLGGTLVATINEGLSNVTFNNVTYNVAETGVSITASATSGMSLTPATSALFEVIEAATHLAFVDFPEEGTVNQVIAAFDVEARRSDGTIDLTYTGEITLTKESGPGTLEGTLTHHAVAGVATFDDISFDEAGEYTLTAAATGLTAATSNTIIINDLPEGLIAQWNFNGPSADEVPGGPESPEPSVGVGTANLAGGTTASFASGVASGGSSDPETTVPPNYAWNTTTYPAQGTNPKTAGVQFNVSTVGYQDITFMFDQRLSNTAANTWVVQYTLDASASSPEWLDAEMFTFEPQETGTGDVWYNQRTVDLSAVTGLNNNPNVGVRIVSDFDPVAGEYLAARSTSTYGPNGTSRFDMVTFMSEIAQLEDPVQLAFTSINGGVPPTAGIPFSVIIQSRDENNNPAHVTEDTQITLSLATGTGQLGGTLVAVIIEGSNSVTFNNVIYDTAEEGVSLTAEATDGMTLEPATSELFEVVGGATQLAFVGFPENGTVAVPVASFTVEARRDDGSVDQGFSGTISLSKHTGPGNVNGTLEVQAVNGIAAFSDISFDTEGTYTLLASAEGLTDAVSSNIEIEALPGSIITQWNFNDETLDPNIGEGTAANVGGTSTSWAAGVPGNPDRGWNTSEYPAQNTGIGYRWG
jgi:predicted aspartyl protease